MDADAERLHALEEPGGGKGVEIVQMDTRGKGLRERDLFGRALGKRRREGGVG